MSTPEQPPDPFAAFESERTIIKPRPRAPAGATPPPAPAMAPPPAAPVVDVGAVALLNPLVSAASPLLGLIASLRQATQAPQVPALRASLVAAVQRFEAQAQQAGVAQGAVVAARYVLCTALDEAVANTPWGAQAGWNKQSLLVQFHNETWGGEKVFQLLAKLAQDVPANRQLLELLYCVLALGFEGRYRVIDNGRAQLDGVRQRLADLIRQHRPTPESDLSPHWRGQAMAAGRLTDGIPLWIMGAALALLLALTFVGLRLALNYRSDTTYAAVSSLRVPGIQVVAAPAPVPAKVPRLKGFLEPEIREGLVTVLEEADRTVVRLRGDSFFASGSAEPTTQSLPVLRRIGEALAEVKGDVLVLGHSDNQPIRSARYPSNWHLSTARAEGVKAALAQVVDPARMRASGKADAEPIGPNDTAADRARNRRVDVVLLPDARAVEGAK